MRPAAKSASAFSLSSVRRCRESRRLRGLLRSAIRSRHSSRTTRPTARSRHSRSKHSRARGLRSTTGVHRGARSTSEPPSRTACRSSAFQSRRGARADAAAAGCMPSHRIRDPMACERVRPTDRPSARRLGARGPESPRLCVAAVVSEELGEHLLPGAHTQELCMRAKLGPVVRRRRGGCAQLELRQSERVEQHLQRLAVVMLDARRFIQHHAAEDRRVKPMQPVIVRDVDARPHFRSIADVLNLHRQRGPSDTVCAATASGARINTGSFVCRRTASAHASCIRDLPSPVSAKMAARPRRSAHAVSAD